MFDVCEAWLTEFVHEDSNLGLDCEINERSGVDGPSIRSSVAKQSGYSLTLRSSNEMLGIALVSRSVGDFGLHPALRGHCRRLRRRKSSWQIANVTSIQCRGFGHLPRSGQSSEICAHQNFSETMSFSQELPLRTFIKRGIYSSIESCEDPSIVTRNQSFLSVL